MTREYVNEVAKISLDHVDPSEIETQYIRQAFVELGSRYVCQLICLYILYKINEVKSDDNTDSIFPKFHQVADVDSLCKYFPVFYPAFRHSNDLCYCALSNFMPPSLQEQDLETIIYANNVNDNIKLMKKYPLHLLANELEDIWDSCICSMIFIVCGVQMDLLNDKNQTAVQIALLKNGALFSVLMNLKIDAKVKQMYSPSSSPIPFQLNQQQPQQQQQLQQGFQFRQHRPSSGIPRTASIGSRGGISPRNENDNTPATVGDIEVLRKEMKDMQSEFGATLLLFGKITGVYGEAMDIDETLGSVYFILFIYYVYLLFYIDSKES